MPSLLNPYSKFLTTDEASPMEAEVIFEKGRRHDARETRFAPNVDSATFIQGALPWQKPAIALLAKGLSCKEVASLLDIAPNYLSAILKIEWFQAELALAMEKEIEPLATLIKGAGVSAFLTIKEISEDEKAPKATRLAAAKEILDRNLGKATQFLEVKSESRNTNIVEDTKRLEEEAARLRSRLNLHDSN